MPERTVTAKSLELLDDLIAKHQGSASVLIQVETADGMIIHLRPQHFFRVNVSPELTAEIEKMGVSRIVREAMQIAGKIYKEGSKWIVEMPAEHWLVKQLMKSWKQLKPLPVDT